jgi:hypothetical protein
MDGCSLCLEDHSSKLSTISWAPTLESQPSRGHHPFIVFISAKHFLIFEEAIIVLLDALLIEKKL